VIFENFVSYEVLHGQRRYGVKTRRIQKTSEDFASESVTPETLVLLRFLRPSWMPNAVHPRHCFAVPSMSVGRRSGVSPLRQLLYWSPLKQQDGHAVLFGAYAVSDVTWTFLMIRVPGIRYDL